MTFIDYWIRYTGTIGRKVANIYFNLIIPMIISNVQYLINFSLKMFLYRCYNE